MTTQEKQKALETIIRHYGPDAQINMVIEECSELIKALLKFRRADMDGGDLVGLRKDIVGEMADVEIMLRQMEIVFAVSDGERDAEIDRKIQRQLRRIGGGDGE